MEKTLKYHQDVIAAIYGEGASVCDWLVENNMTDVIVYSSRSFYENYLPIIISLINDERINFGGLYSLTPFVDRVEGDLVYYMFGARIFRDISTADLSKYAVITLTPHNNSKIDGMINDHGQKKITANTLIRETFIRFMPCYNALVTLQKKNRSAHFIHLRLPVANKDHPYYNHTLLGLKESFTNLEIPDHYKKYNFDLPEASELFKVPSSSFSTMTGIKFDDKSSKYVNIRNGHRVTTGQTDGQTKRKIWFIGGCRIFGICSPDNMTIESYLQATLNEAGKDILVENHGYFMSGQAFRIEKNIENLPIGENDIVISNFYNPFPDEKISREAQVEFDKHLANTELYSYNNHFTPDGNKLLSDIIYQYLIDNDFYSSPKTTSNLPEVIVSKDNKSTMINPDLEEYKASLAEVKLKIGSIVMNCNPFTLGHRYLIEYAAKQVNQLYIFVVEEDKSIFPFKDRLALVKAGTADLPNVTVIPSGKFIISQLTFADYFNKADIQDKQIDPTQDLELFATEIAPTLNINVRFAGEEPLDLVTKQYNDGMSRILPKYGIEFHEIPRKEENGGVISASRVRKNLDMGDWAEIEQLVPQTTLSYLKEKFM